ncbi:MAG: sulfite exporter TauE/SafE family protein [Deltaproteobacteria bacterium]|nr:sulfite exporter TauE/SafE family protein [Deltaproteobacteria bacterium]
MALLAALVGVAALLYSSVGHGGGSGYLAAMALFGLAPSVMKPSALAMNVLVALVVTIRFRRAGYFEGRLLWPFAIGSIPAAFVGGYLTLAPEVYRTVLGALLLVAATRMATKSSGRPDGEVRPPHFALGLLIGAAIGFASGITGIGGGIFLSPIILLAGWAGLRQTAAVSAPFILLNSLAGLAGVWTAVRHLPPFVPLLAVVAVAGGLVGSGLGARYLSTRTLRLLLAIALAIAGAKLVLT